MTEKIDIKEARLAVRGKFEDNGDPSWDDMCALVLETVCFAAETFADGTARWVEARGEDDAAAARWNEAAR